MEREVWSIEVEQTLELHVSFSEPVSKEDAARLYSEGLYEEIIDEDIASETVIGVVDD